MKRPRILLAEDDPNLGQLLREFLEVKGHEVGLCTDGEAAVAAFSPGRWDCCILDVMMPRRDGFSVAKAIRAADPLVPVLFLTARGLLPDKQEGFALGADDYVTKPFSMEELLLRIGALLRRTQASPAPPEASADRFRIGRFHFDYTTRELSSEQQLIQRLTTREADLLRLLAMHPNEVLRRETALRQIWGDDSYFNARSMDVFITKLRKYLASDPSIEIMNVHGTGYKLLVRGA